MIDLIIIRRIYLFYMLFHYCIDVCFIFASLQMVSTKFYCGHDEEVYISDWAKEGNITEERMKELEIDFLCAIVSQLLILSHFHYVNK